MKKSSKLNKSIFVPPFYVVLRPMLVLGLTSLSRRRAAASPPTSAMIPPPLHTLKFSPTILTLVDLYSVYKSEESVALTLS